MKHIVFDRSTSTLTHLALRGVHDGSLASDGAVGDVAGGARRQQEEQGH